MTKMQTTSLWAYQDLKGSLQPREKEVLQALQQIEPACDRDIARHLKWEISSVNGRRNSLVTKGRIIEAYKNKGVTGKTVIYWKLANDQTELFREYGDTY
jgi:DNA-binding MarR family transcriptional regulator